jgi:UrcA family protein
MKSLMAAAAMGLALAGTAHASTWRVGGDYVVRVDDLRLSAAGDRAELLARIDEASRRICRNAGQPGRACRAEAAKRAVQDAPPAARVALKRALGRSAEPV